MPQCACAELFKIGDDYTLDHHPDCLEALIIEPSVGFELLRGVAEENYLLCPSVMAEFDSSPAIESSEFESIETRCECGTAFITKDTDDGIVHEFILDENACTECLRIYHFSMESVLQ